MNVLSIGDNAADCYISQNLFFPGGNAVNFIVNMKRCGAARCGYIGVFGDDLAADHIRRTIDEEGIELTRTRRMYAKTARPIVNLTEDGDRIFTCSPQDAGQHLVRLSFTEDDTNYIKGFDLIYASCFSGLERELPMLKDFAPLAFDFSIWPEPEYMKIVCPNIKYGFFSAAHLSPSDRISLIESAHNLGVEIVGLTLGQEGALFSKKGKLYYQKAVPTNIIDTMGAGDSFNAAFLAKYHNNEGMEDALLFAAERAAETCRFYGAFGYPKGIYRGLL